MKTLLTLFLSAIAAFAQGSHAGSRDYNGSFIDRSQATFDAPHQGPTLPATCGTPPTGANAPLSPLSPLSPVVETFLLTTYTPATIFTCSSANPNVWYPTLPSLTLNGIPLLSPVFHPSMITALAPGHNDLYTAPACTLKTVGCNRQLVSVYAAATISSTTHFNPYTEIKHNGSYYAVSAISVGVLPGNNTTVFQYILDPGEGLSVNVTDGSLTGTFYAVTSYLSFDSNTPLRAVKAFGIQSGSTIIYAPPAGKNGIILGTTGLPFASGASARMVYDAAAPTLGTTELHYVPPSGTADATNLVTAYAAAGLGTLQSISSPSVPEVIPNGYSVVLIQSFNSTVQSYIFNVYEY